VEVGVPDGWGPVGVDKQQMDHVLAVMEGSLGKAGCDVVVLRRRNTHLHSVDTPGVSRASIALWRPFQGVHGRSFGRVGATALLLDPAASKHGPYEAADVVVRRRSGIAQPLEVRVAIIGNVDSGKSTLVGVMTRRCARCWCAATCKGRTCGVAAACQLACVGHAAASLTTAAAWRAPRSSSTATRAPPAAPPPSANTTSA
jgi:hypothetical protein